ncbi:MAG: hypothetical protein IJ083_15665 [Clostridia bacterium]|nr:hypothetical protein [Clostridia bacterium]
MVAALLLLFVHLCIPSTGSAAANYNTYLYSTGTHYLANCATGETGPSGQIAGDQSGNEYKFSSWAATLSNGNGWVAVFRYPDQKVALKIAQLSIDAVNNNHIGYDWGYPDRETYWNELKKVNYDPSAITTDCEADCSSAVCTNVRAAGYLLGISALKNVSMANTSTLTNTLVNAGFQKLTGSIYLSQKNYLLPGDILLASGHTLVNLTKGANASWEAIDTEPPAITGSTSNASTTGFDVAVTAKDDSGIDIIQIGVWHDNMSISNAQWQTANNTGSASFRVNVSDFGNALDTTYHVNAFAKDKAGNTSSAVRIGDVYLEDPAKYHNLGIDITGPWSGVEFPGKTSSIREGALVNLADYQMEVSDELAVSYVFDHWESTNGGTFGDAKAVDTTFTMPAADTKVYKVYRAMNNLRLWILCTTGGGVSVTGNSENVTIPTGSSRGFYTNVHSLWSLLPEPAEGYRFSGWDTSDFDFPNGEKEFATFNMPGKNVTIQAVFEEDPYYPVVGLTFRLPDGLTTIEREAFEGVKAKYFIIPDSVTDIESNAFPQDSVVYLNTHNIQSIPADAITGSGTYIETNTITDYGFAEALIGTNYIVLDRNKKHIAVWGDWSGWTEDYREVDDNTQVESKIQYRSRSKSVDDVYGDWSGWVSNGSTPISGTDQREVKTVSHAAQTKTVYTYDHYKYYNTSKSAWYYSYADNSANSWSTQGKWEYAQSDTPYTQYSWASSAGYDGWRDGSQTPWFHQGTKQETVVAAYTEYQYRTRTLNQETVYGNWSEWSDSVVTGNDSLDVEIRTVYRYRYRR